MTTKDGLVRHLVRVAFYGEAVVFFIRGDNNKDNDNNNNNDNGNNNKEQKQQQQGQ